MFFKSRFFQFTIAILSIIGYGTFAFAIIPPGQTLDPVHDGLCSGPTDVGCKISFAPAIGDTIGNSPVSHGLLYTDASGNLTNDAEFIRNLTTGITSIGGTGQLAGSTLLSLQGNTTITLMGNTAPLEGNISSTTNGDYISLNMDGHFDISAFAALPPSSIWAEQAGLGVLNTVDGNSANIYARKLPAVFGGDYTSALELDVNGISGINKLESDGSGMDWQTRISDGATFENKLSFSNTNPLEWRWGTNTIWKMPTTQGTSGQTLILAADNTTLSWGAAGGSSPILLDNGNTFYSTNSGYTPNSGSNYSFFVGGGAGSGATNADSSNFLGQAAGYNATNAFFSNFLGQFSGRNAINAIYSNFFGLSAGDGATNADSSNFLGTNAGNNATHASGSNFLGTSAGNDATHASGSNFLGLNAGYQAVYASNSNFLGYYSGHLATNASNSNFLGYYAGDGAVNAANSNFLGTNAGSGATGASSSNFLGTNAGSGATDAFNSNFLGTNAGYGATYAIGSNFLGTNAGQNATNAANSIFIGNEAGKNDTVNTVATNNYSILLGPNTSTGGNSNSIAIGAYATNTLTNQFMIGSSTHPINDMTIIGSGFTTCTVDTGTGAGISCSSDERLKTNINDLDGNTLDKLSQLRAVTYNWKDRDSSEMIGFLAQNMQEQFPQLVSEGATGYLSVNYAGMTPILTKAIQELDLKIESIESIASSVNTTFLDSLRVWLGDVGNGIEKIFAKVIESNTLKAKEQLCVGETCISESELIQLLESRSVVPVSSGENENHVDVQDNENTPDSEQVLDENQNDNPEEIVSNIPNESEIVNTGLPTIEEQVPGTEPVLIEPVADNSSNTEISEIIE